MYVGIDIGTGSVKSVLMGEDGAIHAASTFPVAVSRPRSGWSEQDPEHWWAAVCETLDALAAAEPRRMATVTGLGLSGHMHGATLLDAQDNVLRPAILWNDGRASAECAEIESACPDARAITGNIAMPGFTAPKVAWVRRHEPEIFARIAKVLLPKDYVRLKLTGTYGSDMSDAAGTYWLDVGARRWSDELLAATGLERSQMPELFEGTQATGRLRDRSARAGVRQGAGRRGRRRRQRGLGLRDRRSEARRGLPVARHLGRAVRLERALLAEHRRCGPRLLPCPARHLAPDGRDPVGDRQPQLVRPHRRRRCAGPDRGARRARRETLACLLHALPLRANGHRTTTPARGGFLGLSQSTTREEMTQAVLEGVGFAFRDCLRVLQDAGTDVERAFAVGGGANSPVWLSILASLLDRPLDVSAAADVGAAYGAARLGQAAATESSDPAALMPPPAVERTIEPDPALARAYADRYGRYRELYAAAAHAAD